MFALVERSDGLLLQNHGSTVRCLQIHTMVPIRFHGPDWEESASTESRSKTSAAHKINAFSEQIVPKVCSSPSLSVYIETEPKDQLLTS